MAKRKQRRKPKKPPIRVEQQSMPAENPIPRPDDSTIVDVLNGYWQEADNSRRTGFNPRDEKWEQNLALYWNRIDHSQKADWQAKENMPEVPTFVDRFAAALKEALVAAPTGFYTVVDPSGQENTFDDLTTPIKAALDVWLSTAGRNQTGTCLNFTSVFEEQVKLGSMMAMSSVVAWKNDVPFGRIAIETVDPRMVWLDHTYRNLYRIRRTELDKHELVRMVKARDSAGKAIWNHDGINRMVAHIEAEDSLRREQLHGGGNEITSTREPIIMDEYVATVVDGAGRVLAEDALMVVGNKQFLLRGPEPNPFWHKKDWLVYAPLVTVPLSVYGRSYMEDFGTLANTFNRLTNLLLDAVQTSSLKAYALVPAMLLDPSQANTGIWPNKFFLLEDGMKPEDFFKALDLGTLPPESLNFWTAIKNELREAADLNEVGLGQFAPKSRTSATEISTTQESSSALIRSVAQTVEARWLNPTLDLAWQTGIQHVRRDDTMIAAAFGPELWASLWPRRRELLKRPYRFQANGISMLIQKSRMLKALMGILQVIAQSEPLMALFLQEVDLSKLMRLLFVLSDVDMRKIQPTQADKMMQAFRGPAGLAQGRMNQNLNPAMRADPQAAAGLQQFMQGAGISRRSQ